MIAVSTEQGERDLQRGDKFDGFHLVASFWSVGEVVYRSYR